MTSTSERRTTAKPGTSPASTWPTNLTVEYGQSTPGTDWTPGMPGERFDVYLDGAKVGTVESFAKEQTRKVTRGIIASDGYKMRWRYSVAASLRDPLTPGVRRSLPCTSRVRATADLINEVTALRP